METLKEGKLVNKFIGLIIHCSKCEGHFRLTKDDLPHNTHAQKPPAWTRTFVQPKEWFWIACPTEGCGEHIEFSL